jgi:putative endonuclease
MTNSLPSHYRDKGELGEDLVAQWLQSTGWIILHRRFACRWGEIDIIAEYPGTSALSSILAFVEVKTRSSGNWDAGGRSAITPQKQAKLWRTAGMFLAQYPQKADYSCRFDVAIVHYQRLSNNLSGVIATADELTSLSTSSYKLKLQEYIPAAFEYSIDIDNV